MAEPPLHAVPHPDDPAAEPVPDAATLARVAAALADLDYLRAPHSPAGAPDLSGDPMPEAVWLRLRAEIADAARSPAGRRASRTTRWLGGVVAAGVVIVAVGIAAVALRGAGPAVVAGDAGGQAKIAASASAAPAGAAGSAELTAPADGSAEVSAAEAAPEPTREPVPEPAAARVVLDSRTAYQPTTLRSQVTALVKGAGFATVRDAMTRQAATPVLPAKAGFTSSWARLRDCVTRLTRSDHAQALVVDRGTYAGADAGVVVAPVDFTLAADQAAPPTAVVATPVGTFDIWVVDPDCDQVAASVSDFPLYAWQP